MLVAMSEFVDPIPIEEEQLRAIAAEFEPKIAALELAVGAASGAEARRLKRDLRNIRDDYRRAMRHNQVGGCPW